MKEEQLNLIRDDIKETITTVVNGKIDRLTVKIDDHILKHEADWEEIKPFVQGVVGARIIGGLLKWVAGIAGAWILIRQFLIQ